MDLRKIENLIHVADSGSFSKAASVLGIAQSALGRQVRKLEEECGCALLYRNGRGVSLTPEGEKLLDRLRPLLAQMTRVVTEFHDDQKSPSGQVTLGLTPTLCHMVGMPLVAEVWKRHPRIQLNVITGYSGYVHEWLANARVDIAVLHDARRSQHIAVDPLAELDLALVSPAQNLSPAARALACIDFEQLRGLPLALPTRNHGLRRTLEHAAAQAGLPLDVAFEMDALELMKEIVLEGMAHTVLALPAVVRELASGQLVARRIVNPGLSTRLMLATASSRPLTQAVKIVQGILRELLAAMASSAPYRPYMRMAGMRADEG
ncbi:MAG: LysR family transcriptional regulator [Achromobacter sp.]|uniref:LysR family transcriptional regulator n=1 Tax=Achromobacter sp. TaxID=134375 RepID=UPI00258EEBC4|nr:LysR family transcriptional regulator [Achromobacter sp.]MCW0209892.1 LysR family transcriptional regulator [Achromobacter sp.]